MSDPGNRAREFLTTPLLLVALAMLSGVLGCGDRTAQTPTRGEVSFSISEEVLPLMLAAENRFEELYPEAKITLRPKLDREAIADLFNDSVKLIVTARPLNEEERAVQQKFNLEVREFQVALDGIGIIVNDANEVSRLTLPQLDSLLTGIVMDWGLLGWKKSPGKIALYLPDKNSAAYEVLSDMLPGLGAGARGYLTPRESFSTSGALISAVNSDPAGVGIVGLNWMREDSSAVRILELSNPSAPESLGISGKYFSPHQAYLFNGYYPLVRGVYIYSTPDSYGVTSGFTSFMTSVAGQKIVQSQGLVPATMPVRLVSLRNDSL